MRKDFKHCPNCLKNVSGSNFTMHNVHCQRNITTCSLCQEPVPRNQYQQHVEAKHSSIRCQDCGNHVEAVDLFYHQKDLCPKRLIPCRFCELEVTAEELEKHLEFCGARTDRCKGCTKYVQFKYLQFHYENDHKYLDPGEKEKAEVEGKEGDDGEECPVCLGPVTLPLTLECGHVFCMVCVKGIANTTKNCAICRRDIQRDMLMDIRFCREEDIIKNYVNNPKYKKARSKSVPSRRLGITTEDYDHMVSALLSSRISSSNYRYQRPNNGHTPSPYTPYCYVTANTTSSTTSTQSTISSNSTTTSSSCQDSFRDDDCCCSSTKESEGKKEEPKRVASPRPTPPTSETQTSSTSSVSTGVRSASVAPSSDKCCASSVSKETVKKPARTSAPTEPFSSTQGPAEGKPRRRPTTLALQKEDKPRERSQPQHLSQEEYDRWLAFQLAQAEDEMSATEFNKTHRSPFRRSRSMPESKEDSTDFVRDVENSTFSSTSERAENNRNEIQNRLPPTSPRCSSAASTSMGNSNSGSATKGTSLTKSSSDSCANGNSVSSNTNSAITTGARPKSSTGLKKRVSFKEEAPQVRRQAPVMLPCEFCDEMFAERDLMRHQTSCDQNETKNPREYLLSRRSSVTSPITSPTSPLPPSPIGIHSSLNVASLSKPPLVSSYGRSSESPSRANSQIRSLRTPPQSPSPRPRPNHSPISPPQSPSSASPQPASTLSEGYYSPFASRHASVSPGPGVSVSSSSGVSSGISSINSSSVSTTPSTSSSASPVPATTQPSTPGTPTDIEADFEEEDSGFARPPRKGRLLSSAISSWRSISGSKPNKDHLKYARSNTAPLEVTADEEPHSSEITTSHSASYLRSALSQDDSDGEDQETSAIQENNHDSSQPVFVKNKNKYHAPPPPPPLSTNYNNSKLSEKEKEEVVSSTSSNYQVQNERQRKVFHIKNDKDTSKSNIFKFDSVPAMHGNVSQNSTSDLIPCEFCKEVFSPRTFRAHQAMCEVEKETPSKTNHSKTKDSQQHATREQKQSVPSRRNKGPAPQPPSESETPKRKPIERSHSVRETNSECRYIKDFESTGRRLERAGSIKETSRFSRTNGDSPPRKWLSREGFYGSSLDCSAAYSGGGSLTSSNTSLNNYSSTHGWSSHINMIRDEVRSRRSSYVIAGTSSPTTPFFGATRYRDRSSSRHRPSSLYSSRHAFTIIADAFAAASEKPVTRKKKKAKAPDPPFKKTKRKLKVKNFAKLKNLVRMKFK